MLESATSTIVTQLGANSAASAKKNRTLILTSNILSIAGCGRLANGPTYGFTAALDIKTSMEPNHCIRIKGCLMSKVNARDIYSLLS